MIYDLRPLLQPPPYLPPYTLPQIKDPTSLTMSRATVFVEHRTRSEVTIRVTSDTELWNTRRAVSTLFGRVLMVPGSSTDSTVQDKPLTKFTLVTGKGRNFVTKQNKNDILKKINILEYPVFTLKRCNCITYHCFSPENYIRSDLITCNMCNSLNSR